MLSFIIFNFKTYFTKKIKSLFSMGTVVILTQSKRRISISNFQVLLPCYVNNVDSLLDLALNRS